MVPFLRLNKKYAEWSKAQFLGLLTFMVYIHDLPKCLKSTTNCFYYADDTEFFTSSPNYDTLAEDLNNDFKIFNT